MATLSINVTHVSVDLISNSHVAVADAVRVQLDMECDHAKKVAGMGFIDGNGIGELVFIGSKYYENKIVAVFMAESTNIFIIPEDSILSIDSL